MKHSIYSTIENISYSYNPKTESGLAQFVASCLFEEKISCKDNLKGTLYFCGYENMIIFFRKGLMDLHTQKRMKFLRLIKNSRFSLHFRSGTLCSLRQISQSKLAKSLGTSQSGVCKMLAQDFIGVDN
ncbi:MAG: hypothetical protein KJ922_00710, partial [Nanoarchaeota archaeon]|nr:hypothetical protein [Nanoarchaeota archaeon]